MTRYFLFILMFTLTIEVYSETLMEADTLKKIKGVENWPVIDVRELSDRSQSPIPGALEFGFDLAVEGNVLVVASTNNSASLVAKAIEARIPTAKVYVIIGGFETLRTIRPELEPSKDNFIMPGTFVIPSDTCKQGNPLQIYSDEKAK